MTVLMRHTRLLAVGVALIGCGKAGDGAAPAEAGGAPVTSIAFSSEQVAHGAVKWARATAVTVAATVELPAQIVPNDDRTSRVSAPAEGRIVSVHVAAGDHVVAGQALATIQGPAGAAARADRIKALSELASRKTAATYARAARDRADRLLVAKAAARQDVERAHADDEQAQALLAQAQAELDRTVRVTAQLGVDDEGAMVLKSPLDGVVLRRDVVPGAVVGAGVLVVTVADVSTLWLDIAVTEGVAGSVRVGSHVRFRAATSPDTLEARIDRVGAGLDSTTRTLLARASVANEKGRLRPATYATAWIELGASRSGFSVPDDAVQLLDEKPVVFVARPDGKGGALIERRDVELGARSGGRTQVVKGIAAADVVVTHGAFAVKSEFARSKMAGG